MLRPRSDRNQWVASETYEISPTTPVYEYADSYGNLCQRLIAPAGPFHIKTSSEIKIIAKLDQHWGAPFVEVQNLPEGVLNYLMPSRYVESDRLGWLANNIVQGCLMGYDQVAQIETWLRDNINYVPGSSDMPLSAVEVKGRGFGICRDLAHLGIALCRSLTIPARMVV
jgi:transglutaminase-like putative cysteine protease